MAFLALNSNCFVYSLNCYENRTFDYYTHLRIFEICNDHGSSVKDTIYVGPYLYCIILVVISNDVIIHRPLNKQRTLYIPRKLHNLYDILVMTNFSVLFRFTPDYNQTLIHTLVTSSEIMKYCQMCTSIVLYNKLTNAYALYGLFRLPFRQYY